LTFIGDFFLKKLINFYESFFNMQKINVNFYFILFAIYVFIFIISKESILFNEELLLVISIFLLFFVGYNFFSGFFFNTLENRNNSIVQIFLNFYIFHKVVINNFVFILKRIFSIKNSIPFIYFHIYNFFDNYQKNYKYENNSAFVYVKSLLNMLAKEEFFLEQKIFNHQLKKLF
jgi:hypothetical protein